MASESIPDLADDKPASDDFQGRQSLVDQLVVHSDSAFR
jgi:hypothetical protein